jgi:hypothetical protein
VITGSPGYNPEFVIDRYSQKLPVAHIAFRGLHRDVTEKELNLLELASRIMAKAARMIFRFQRARRTGLPIRLAAASRSASIAKRNRFEIGETRLLPKASARWGNAPVVSCCLANSAST